MSRARATTAWSVWNEYLQVSRDVGSGQDASGSREEDGKHREKGFAPSEIGCKIIHEDFRFKEKEEGGGQQWKDHSCFTSLQQMVSC